MGQMCRAVLILEEDAQIPAGGKPLMLETILRRPIMEWAAARCMDDGIRRFFVVCPPRFAQAAAACFPEGAEVTVSERHADLLDFLDTDEETLVLCRAAMPFDQAGPGFAYAASGRELREVWEEKMTNAVSAARLIPGWLPIFGPETVAELEAALEALKEQGKF